MDWLVVRAFLTMMMIVGLMFALLVVVRKYFFNRPNISNENMKVLSSLSLQPKKSIFLVKVFNKVMLVGISDNSIAALGEITDEETLEIIDATAQRKQMKGFSEILKGLSLK
jgi:flagellar biosynthetic protein FliO